MLRALSVLLIAPVVTMAGPVLTTDDVTIETYEVSGRSLLHLSAQLSDKGPKGYWGYTSARWDWDDDCNVKFHATVTLPRHSAPERLAKPRRQVFERMLTALTAHEMEHVRIAREWASAIKAADCDDARLKEIDDHYRALDLEFDRRTNHGRREGVHLRP